VTGSARRSQLVCAGDSPARSPPLILFPFPHESKSWKVHCSDGVLPSPSQLRPDRTAAAAIPRIPKPPTDLRASRKGNRVTLIGASPPAPPTAKACATSVRPRLPQPRTRNHDVRNFATMLPAPSFVSAAPQKSGYRVPPPRPTPTPSTGNATAGPVRRSHLCRRGVEPPRPRRGIVESRARPAVVTLPPPTRISPPNSLAMASFSPGQALGNHRAFPVTPPPKPPPFNIAIESIGVTKIR